MWPDELTSQVRGLRSTQETRLGQGHTACKSQSQVLKKKKKPGLELQLWSLLFLVLAEKMALQSSLKEKIPKAVGVTLCFAEPQRALQNPASHLGTCDPQLTQQGGTFRQSVEAQSQLKGDGIQHPGTCIHHLTSCMALM